MDLLLRFSSIQRYHFSHQNHQPGHQQTTNSNQSYVYQGITLMLTCGWMTSVSVYEYVQISRPFFPGSRHTSVQSGMCCPTSDSAPLDRTLLAPEISFKNKYQKFSIQQLRQLVSYRWLGSVTPSPISPVKCL